MNIFLSNFAAENAVLPLDVAIYRACKDRHGSKAAIAEINGFNPMVFSKCVDINNDQYHLHPEHIEAVLSYTKDIRIMHSLAASHGGAVVYEFPNNLDVEMAAIEKDAMCLIAAVALLKKIARAKAERDAEMY